MDQPIQQPSLFSKPLSKRLVLTSVNQLLSLIKANPKLSEGVPKLAQLSTTEYSAAPKKSCNCGSKSNITTTDAGKQKAENVLSSMSDSDFQQIKNVLDLSELCYYKREDNQLKMICL